MPLPADPFRAVDRQPEPDQYVRLLSTSTASPASNPRRPEAYPDEVTQGAVTLVKSFREHAGLA
jgi:hypothetical protein